MKLGIYKGIICGCTALLIVAALLFRLYEAVDHIPAAAELDNIPTIVIDPGHGGIDGGAVGVDGIVEKDINLAISLALRDMLTAGGFNVIMTRETDISIHDDGITGTKKQKTSDLHNRLDIVNSQVNGIFISIHQNKFGESKSHGAQMFYSSGHPGSQRLAQILQESFMRCLEPENTRQIKQAGKDLYLMYNAQCPAVLVECGFLSNPGDAVKLADPEYQRKIAFTTYAALMTFLQADSADNSRNLV